MRFPALALALLATPAAAQPDPAAGFTVTNVAADTVFRREGGGLRVRTPPAALKPWLRLPDQYTAATAYAVGGDFEFAATFAAAGLGPKAGRPAGEGNVELAVLDRGPTGLAGVNVTVGPGGRHFHVVRAHPNRGGYHYNIVAFPRTADRGRVAIRRRGAELAFLAADGPAAPLVELVRYPHDPRTSPNLRLSAQTGHAATPTVVDVLLTGLTVTADRVVTGPAAAAVPPPAGVPAAYPVTVRYGPNPARVLADFRTGNDAGKAFAADGGAVRVSPAAAPPPPAGANAYFYRDSRFAVAGDFEVSCRLDFRALGPAAGGGYATAGVSLETHTPLGSVNLCRGVNGAGPNFSVTRYSPTKAGGVWETQTVPTPSGPTCRLVLRRTGAELTMLTADAADGPLAELTRMPFYPGPVKFVRLQCDQGGGGATPVDVAVSDLVIKAGTVYDPADPRAAVGSADPAGAEPVELTAAPAAKSRKWLYLGAGFGAVLAAGLAAAGAAVVWRRVKVS